MSMTLTQKDWLIISAYLDGRLAVAEKNAFEERLNSDPTFKTAFLEIQYTRRLLASLPQKRAPRNFTLSAEYAKKRSLKWGLNRYFGLASAASAIAVVAIFAWGSLFSAQTNMAAPAPMLASVPESAMDYSAVKATDDGSSGPMIINWGPPQQPVSKMAEIGGGSESGSYVDRSVADGLGGGGLPEVPQPNNFTSSATESPMTASLPFATPIPTESSAFSLELVVTPNATENPDEYIINSYTPDPSTLILGLPEPGTEGQTIQNNAVEVQPESSPLPISIIVMIGLGVLSLVSAALALFLRKR